MYLKNLNNLVQVLNLKKLFNYDAQIKTLNTPTY